MTRTNEKGCPAMMLRCSCRSCRFLPATLLSASILLLLPAACNNPVEPDPQPTPPGPAVAWFNGLGYTVDLYFPESDSLVGGAYVTGAVPSDIVSLGDGRFAVLSSQDACLRVFDADLTGGELFTIDLPAGSNPYSMSWDGTHVWITLLLTGQVARVLPTEGATPTLYETGGNPTSIASDGEVVLVGHGNYPDPAVTGGVLVLDAATGVELDSIATPDNVTSMRYFEETGMVHAVTSTYTGDGLISIVDAGSLEIVAQIPTGGSPGAPVRAGSYFASGDGFFSDAVFVYSESGSLVSTWNTGASPVGLAVRGDSMYIADFGADRVYLADWTTRTMLDTLASGDGPQGIAIVER